MNTCARARAHTHTHTHTHMQVANQWRSPQYCFAHRVTAINTCANTYFQSHTPQDIDKVNVHTAVQFYRQCFRDPAAFTLIVVGNFDQEELPALLTRYLAAIPAIPRGDVAAAPPQTNREGDAAAGNGGARRCVDGAGSAALPHLPPDREGIKRIDVRFPAKGVAETLSKWMVRPLCRTNCMTRAHARARAHTHAHEGARACMHTHFVLSSPVPPAVLHAKESTSILHLFCLFLFTYLYPGRPAVLHANDVSSRNRGLRDGAQGFDAAGPCDAGGCVILW